jgi:protein-tyrosine phosphatase
MSAEGMMFDLHCHLLPGIDDGAIDLDMSIRMARVLVSDGVEAVVCTPHITPGLYDNAGPQIQAAVASLRRELALRDVQLELFAGADAHVAAGFLAKLRSGEIPSLADSRYVLVELPHDVAPVLLKHFFFELLVNGYVPILSHPERARWIPEQFATLKRLVRSGLWIQITAGSLLGHFGSVPQYWSERLLSDGLVHLVATDAHRDTGPRAPCLARARDAVIRRMGERSAGDIFSARPLAVLRDAANPGFATAGLSPPNPTLMPRIMRAAAGVG